MANPKFKSTQLKTLFPEKKEVSNTSDKLVVEAIRKKLNDQLSKDPALCKKAASVLSSWINSKKK